MRFLWRCARSFLRRLCLLIFAFRRFFNEPIIDLFVLSLTVCMLKVSCNSVRLQLCVKTNRSFQQRLACGMNRLPSIHHFVQRIFDDSFRPGGLQRRDQLADDVLVDDRLHRHPALLAELGDGRVAQRGQGFQQACARFFCAMFIFRPDLGLRLQRAL